MKAILVSTALACTLAACANTWQGVKEDTARNIGHTENSIERGVDKTKAAVKRGGHAVGEGISDAGERLKNATE